MNHLVLKAMWFYLHHLHSYLQHYRYVNLCGFYIEKNRKSKDKNKSLISLEKFQIDESRHAKMAPLLNYLLKKLHLNLAEESQGALNLTDSMKEV